MQEKAVSDVPPPIADQPHPDDDDELLPVGGREPRKAHGGLAPSGHNVPSSEPSPDWSEIHGLWLFFSYLLSNEERFKRAMRVLRYITATVVLVAIIVTLISVLAPHAHAAITVGGAGVAVSAVSVTAAWLRRRHQADVMKTPNRKPKRRR
jgi:hypothetical protein